MKRQTNDKLRGGMLMRMRGLVRKEFYQVIRDPSSIAIAFVMPLILLILFGYGVSLNAKHVPIAIVLEDKSQEAENFVAEFQGTEYFKPLVMSNISAAIEKMMLHQINAIIVIKQDFARKLNTYSEATIQVQPWFTELIAAISGQR